MEPDRVLAARIRFHDGGLAVLDDELQGDS
jgi:hypothetical protein